MQPTNLAPVKNFPASLIANLTVGAKRSKALVVKEKTIVINQHSNTNDPVTGGSFSFITAFILFIAPHQQIVHL